MKRVPVIGRIEPGSGRATMIRGQKVLGEGERFIPCPACGAILDKTDLAGLLAHEEMHGREG